jgi:cell division protein FtsB
MVRVGLLVFGFLTLGMVVLTFVSDRGWLAVREKEREHQELEERIRQMEEENSALGEEIEALRFDADEVERRAREELKLVRPGEVILVLPSEEADPTED